MIYFVVDSTFNVSDEFAKANNINIVSLKVELDGTTYYEGDRSSWQTFFDALKITKQSPMTSCPTPESFSERFEEVVKNDKNAEIICLTFSQALSGTYDSARIASDEFKEKYSNKFQLIDLKSYTGSSRLLLEQATEDVAHGKSFEEVISNINENKEKAYVVFMPPNMEALRKGGRVSLLKTVIADSLHIKPVLCFKCGELKISKLALGIMKGLSAIANSASDKIKRISVMVVCESPFVEKLKELVGKKYNKTDVDVFELGPVAASHVGIGSVGIAVIEE